MVPDESKSAARGRRGRASAWMACLGLLALALSGCGAFYWGKPGGTAEQFERDSVECAKQATPAAAGSLYGLGSESIYKTCLRSRGWVREQKSSPEPGWFRGIEGWH